MRGDGRTRAALTVLACTLAAAAPAADTLDPKVPTPKSVLGYDIGEDHTTYNVARIRGAEPLLSGFAWPEAAERLRGAAYLIDEPHGRGRVILFADDPNYRNFWRGLEKLFTNALLLGPSLK